MFAVDIDPYAVGLYLVDADHRALVHDAATTPASSTTVFDLAERWRSTS